MEDIQLITPDTIAALLNQEPTAPAVTIYVPTHRGASPPNMTEDEIRLKNLIHKAVGILQNRDDDTSELQQTLCDWLETTVNNREFWEGMTNGLLICARPHSFTLYHLPIDTEEYVAVDTHFHLAPVLALLNSCQEYYVLVVAQQGPALLKGDMYDLRPTNLELPKDLNSALNIDEDNQKSEQQRSVANQPAVKNGANQGGLPFNGRGGAKDPHEEDVAKFLRILDKIVCEHTDKSLPLILVGVERETAEYRSLSKYPHILETTMSGALNARNPHELFDQAWHIIRAEVLAKKSEEAIADYQHMKGANPDRAAGDIAAITQAAEEGRVDKLLIAMIRNTADTARNNRDHVPVITFPPDESAQAFHDIALTVHRQSGSILNFDQSNMPDRAAMLARLRY